MNFIGANILSVDQFNLDDVNTLFSVAEKMQPYANREKVTRVLDGAILGNIFLESSTRTRVSFGSAFNLLGGHVRETSDVSSSAFVKGESVRDAARILSGYSDVICIRHPESGSVKEFAEFSRVPVINGGDGSNEHPTQALLDLFTIKKELEAKNRDLSKLRIAIVGDLLFGRTVHSLCKLLSFYPRISVVLVSPERLSMPTDIVESMRSSGLRVCIDNDFNEAIKNVDIIYTTRIQEERFETKEQAAIYRGGFVLNKDIYSKYCAPETVVMHPLPRDSRPEANEIDFDLDSNPNLAIFRQADNGIAVRMAIFAMVLDVVDQIENSSAKVNWHVSR
ncbi:MAG: aspartate carbamoyltransferase [Porticoccaceae bacterium]|nr:aspartate carbamoyltransferase [Porticoccaceae bacterium]